MPFAQLVIGSPGSGKTTYCHGQSQFLSLLSRPCNVINLDPANDRLPYPCSIDINQLISVRDVMSELGLGPNAAMLYCIEYLETNIDWLISRLSLLVEQQNCPGFEYFLFDLPGQVELTTNHTSLKRIVSILESQLSFRFVAVHFTDSTHITEPDRYLSILLLSLRAMLILELPHINVLSKIDLLGSFSFFTQQSQNDGDADADRDGDGLAFNLDFYTQVQDLSYFQQLCIDPRFQKRNPKFAQLNRILCDLVQDFGLVSFETLAVEDRKSMFRLLQVLDKAVGYVFVSQQQHEEEEEGEGEEEEGSRFEAGSRLATVGASKHTLFSVADKGVSLGWGDALEIQERYVDHKDVYDQFESNQRKQTNDQQWEEKIWKEVRKVVKQPQQGQPKS